MRSVSIHMPLNMREANGKPAGPKSSRPGSARHTEAVGIGVVLCKASEASSSIVVQHVWPGSPAEAAGVRRNDVLISIDDVEGSVASAEAAKNCIQGAEGSSVSLRVQRGNEFVDLGPIERGKWVTMVQVDQNLSRMRQLLAENRNPGLLEVCTNLTRLCHTLEEERKAFQDEVALASQSARQSNQSTEFAQHLIEMAENVRRMSESAESLGEPADAASKNTATTRQLSKSAADLTRSVESVLAKLQDAAGQEKIAAVRTELSQMQAQVDALNHLQAACSKEALSTAEPLCELQRVARQCFPGQQDLVGKIPVSGLIDGWKKCIPSEATGPFWYHVQRREVSLRSPGDHNDSRPRATKKRGADTVLCGTQELPARRASFGVSRDVSGVAIRAQPYLADSKLENADRLKGNIALIGRGKCSFVSKAKRAIVAGAVAVVIVNTDDKTCEVVGESTAVKIPVLSIGQRSAQAIRDADAISFVFRTDDRDAAAMPGTPTRQDDGPAYSTLVDRPRKRMSQLATHPEGVVVASASPQPAVVDQQASSLAVSLSRSGLTSKHMTQSLGSASLCSQDGTVVNTGDKAASIGKRALHTPPGEASNHSSAEAAEKADARRAGTPRAMQVASSGRVAGKEEVGAGLERRGRPGGGLLSPQLRPAEDSMWTGSEWSIKSQGSVRGKKAQLKIKLYRMAVEAVGVLKLPAGWDMRMSRTYKQVFFYNRETGERRWSRPANAAVDPRATPTDGKAGGLAADSSVRAEEVLSLPRVGSADSWSPEGREGEEVESVSRLSSGRAMGGGSPPVGAVVSHGVLIPPWPEELRSAMGTMARILLGGKQVVATRAEFGMQAQPSKCKGVVSGRIERVEPWMANGELLNAEALRGAIAVIGRGGCPFTDKARAVEQAGAIAAVIVNHADFLFNVLGEAPEVMIPVVSVTKCDGEGLVSGTLAAVQWGDMAPEMVEEEPELGAGSASWSFKMTSKVVPHGSVLDDEEHPPSVC